MEQSGGGAREGRLGGKVVVVTGGARGIGGATARVAAQQGANVVIGDVLAAEGEETAAAITADGGRCLFVQTDVSQEQECARLMAAAVEHYGRLDALIACAGILWGAFQDVDELDLDTFEHVMDANVQGMFLSVKHAAPHIKTGGGGVILCLSSGAGVRGGSSSVAYGTSKAAVHGLTYVVQPQLAPHNIRVHAICPRRHCDAAEAAKRGRWCPQPGAFAGGSGRQCAARRPDRDRENPGLADLRRGGLRPRHGLYAVRWG